MKTIQAVQMAKTTIGVVGPPMAETRGFHHDLGTMRIMVTAITTWTHVDRPRQARAVETEDIRDTRARPCRQDDLVSSDASVPDLDGVGIDELRLVGVDVDVLQPLAVLEPTSRNGINASEDSVTDGGEGCPAELQIDPQLGCLGRRGRKVRREHEHFRRYAADIEAGAPEGARVDDGGASVGKFLVQDRVSRARTNDDDVVVLHEPSLSSRAMTDRPNPPPASHDSLTDP